MKLNENNLEKISTVLFYFILLVFLFPLIANRWFVTGDGACHLYNAYILKDIFLGQHNDFFFEFYKLNSLLKPNLLDHFVLASFQMIIPSWLAEKLFFILYVFVFLFGAKYLCNQIRPLSTWAALPISIFTFHHLMLKGFMNYSFSIALSFWLIGFFIGNFDKLHDKKVALQLSALFILSYFAHPIGFVFGLSGVAFAGFAMILKRLVRTDAKNELIAAIKQVFPAILALLPAILLYAVSFNPSDFSKPLDWAGLVQLRSLATIVEEEVRLSNHIGMAVKYLFFGGLVWRLYKGPMIHKGDGSLLSGLLFVFLYHANLINDGMIGKDRLVFLPHIAFFGWLITIRLYNWLRLTIALAAVVFIMMISYHRYPAYREASLWVEDVMECEKNIEPKTKVLTINYDYNGTTPGGKTISTINWPFIHGTSYLGTVKPLILSDNYQAHMHWFPLNWKDDTYNFYNSTHIDGMNMENRPPRADINGYARKSSKSPIEYVLIVGRTENDKNHAYSQEIDQQLQSSYELIFTSSSGRSLLYRVKREG